MRTIIYKITGNDTADFKAVESAAEIIKSGGLVAFPTETVYGLGANAYNPEAALKIFKAKGRPADNPLIVHILNPQDAENIAYTNEIYYRLAEKFMPGPLTVIMKKKLNIPDEVTAGLDSVAVRCPKNHVARKLIECAGVPIAAPSANKSGKPSPTSAEHVADDMTGRINMIIDGGGCEFGLESTVVKIDGEKLILLRPGTVTAEMISRAAGVDVVISSAAAGKSEAVDAPLSPGMKYKHYAPSAKLSLIGGDDSDVLRFFELKLKINERCVVLCYDDEAETLEKFAPQIISLGERSDIAGHSKKLFSALREADKRAADEIFAHLPSSEGDSLALYNRMIRSSAYTVIDL